MNRTMRYLITTLGLALAVIVGLTPVQALAAEISYPGGSYASLQEAVNAAAVGDTVKLTADYSGNVSIAKGQDIVLDLGGHTLTGNTSGKYVVNNNGVLTIQNGTVVQGVGNASAIANGGSNESTLTIKEDVTVKAGTGTLAVKNDDYGTLNIEGGTFECGGGAHDCVVANWNKATITGGDFTGSIFNGCYANAGKMTVTNATITPLDGEVAFSEYDDTTCYGTYGGKVSEATFGEGVVVNGPLTDPSKLANTADQTLVVTGGTYESDVTAYLPQDGSLADIDNGDGTHTVGEPVTVTFKTSDDDPGQSVTIVKGSTVAAPEPLADQGDLEFAGWSADGRNEFDFENTLIEQDTTITAMWVPAHYNVTFYDNEGEGAQQIFPTQSVEAGQKATDPGVPTMDGYTFTGWNNYFTGEPFSFDTEIHAGTPLIAQWVKNPTVTFDTDGGSTVDPVTVDYNTAVEEPRTPTKDGYTFAGWVDANGKTFDFGTLITADTTIKATWEKNADPKPEDKPSDGTTTVPVNTANVPAVTTAAVPNTGDATATGMGLVALVGIVAAGAAVVVRRRTRE